MYGFTATTTSQVEAKSINTAPVASKTAVLVSGMTATFQDTSTDRRGPLPTDLNVTVNWGDGTTSTGKGGKYLDQDVRCRRQLCHPAQRDRFWRNDQFITRIQTVTITEKFTIGGTVVDGSSAPLAGAKLSLKMGYTVKSTTLSASDGTYSFNNLLKGCYTVVPSMSGKTFTPASKYLCVGPSSTSVNFTAAP